MSLGTRIFEIHFSTDKKMVETLTGRSHTWFLNCVSCLNNTNSFSTMRNKKVAHLHFLFSFLSHHFFLQLQYFIFKLSRFITFASILYNFHNYLILISRNQSFLFFFLLQFLYSRILYFDLTFCWFDLTTYEFFSRLLGHSNL